jgi:hypothetical protein
VPALAPEAEPEKREQIAHVYLEPLRDAQRELDSADGARLARIVELIAGTYNDLVELMVLAQTGKVTLHTRTNPLSNAVEAIQDLDAGRVRGRAILVP